MTTYDPADRFYAAACQSIGEQCLLGVLRAAGIKPAAGRQKRLPQVLVQIDTAHSAGDDQTVHNRFLPFLRRAASTLRPFLVDIFLRNPCVRLPMMFERVFSVFFMDQYLRG